MPGFLTTAFSSGTTAAPLDLLIRFAAALICGVLIAWVHRATRRAADPSPSFFSTLVLLSVLIAMTTQVIGDNVARAFSLVGALSIVRFRTVLRDTEDTAYVIFAVVTGMAVGAQNLWVAGLGLVVVTAAAVALKFSFRSSTGPEPEYEVTLRFGLGHDLKILVGPAFQEHFHRHNLTRVGTTRQGSSFEAAFRAFLRKGNTADELLQQLSQTPGIHDVQIAQRNLDEN